MANLTDADKVIRNDVGKTIASKLDDIADAIVAQGGGAHSLGQLSDVDINTQTLAEGQSIVYNETTQKFENGEVSTVAALDDLTDVSISSPAAGDSLRYDGNEWIAQPTTIEMTSAEWEAIANKQAWRNAHKRTKVVLTDAPNLNATAQDISYDGGADTVWDKVESIQNSFNPTSYSTTGLIYSGVTLQDGGFVKLGKIVIVNIRIKANSSLPLGTGVISGLPTPIVSNNTIAASNNINSSIIITTTGEMIVQKALSTDEVVMANAFYICS